MNIEARFRALDAHIEAGTLVRNEWGDGKERACLLLAIAPEVGNGDIAACPADLIPPWLARLTPSIDDYGSEAAWPDMVRRYSRVVRLGAERLDDAGWRRVLARFLIFCLERAAHLDPSDSCVRVAALWRQVLAGDEPTQQDWEAAWAEARAAADAAWAAWAAEEAEAWAAWAAEAAEAAAAAAWEAAWAAEAAAAAAAWEAMWAASWAASSAEARAASWDATTTALLDAIEEEHA